MRKKYNITLRGKKRTKSLEIFTFLLFMFQAPSTSAYFTQPALVSPSCGRLSSNKIGFRYDPCSLFCFYQVKTDTGLEHQNKFSSFIMIYLNSNFYGNTQTDARNFKTNMFCIPQFTSQANRAKSEPAEFKKRVLSAIHPSLLRPLQNPEQ